ncbi:hypothetical protein MMC13_000624 [Lambiella insularis]|nr:hypothetical protein [Lambiella insularis]
MWILECDGDILKGKRIWLRPGKQYLFGRTKADGSKYAGFIIAHKSVSRKHLTLSVSAVKPGAASLVHAKSELSLEDENTKVGTEIDGERVKGEKRVLKNDEHEFRLGSYEHLFRIKWKPVVLSFTFPTKETKGGKDPLIRVRSQLEDLDIKAVLHYIVDKTTHVVGAKRNTAKGLQALINGKYIVDNRFVEALVYVTTPGNLDEPESLSALEEDFDGNWPSATEYLPPPGNEPGQRPSELFAPNQDRREVFQDYTFVFCNQRQFDNLQAPITNGAGKALLFPLVMGQTPASDVVRFVKNAAGQKSLEEHNEGSHGKGVIMVKFQGDKGFEDWAIDLQDQIEPMLGWRLIEQNEFLDAILINDASKLRRALLAKAGNGTAAPPSTAASLQPTAMPQTQGGTMEETPPSAQPDIVQVPSKRGRPRGKIVSAFKGFEDDFDQSKILKDTSSIGIGSQFDSVPQGNSQRQTHEASLVDSQMEIDSHEDGAPVAQVGRFRKRPPPSDNDEDDEDINEKLLPAAAAMKRRKIIDEEEAQRRGLSIEPAHDPQKIAGRTAKRPRAQKQIDVQEIVRERREAEEEAARKEEENLQETMKGVNIEEMKNLAVVEDMDIPERTDRPRRRGDNSQENQRWDERWNGRKNFKKFRRQGQVEQRRRGPSVIVPLEEVKKKTHGIGEEYWLESEKAKKKRKEKERASQSQTQPSASTRSHAEEIPSELATGGEPESIDVEAPRTTRLMDREGHLHQTDSRAETQTGKRPAPGGTLGGVPKRQKVFAARESESDSEDDLKFRFKKRVR